MIVDTVPGRKLNIKTFDGDENKCVIHWLRFVPEGKIDTSKVHPQLKHPEINTRGFKAQIACNPAQNSVTSQCINGVYYICQRCDDVRGVTCPKCLALPEAVEKLAEYAKLEAEQVAGVK